MEQWIARAIGPIVATALLGEAGGMFNGPGFGNAQRLTSLLETAEASAARLRIIARLSEVVDTDAPYTTRYQWGYLHEAMEVDGANRLELLFTPCIDQDVHTLFRQQIGATDPAAVHVVIQDQAGFHLRSDDPRVPKNIRLLPLPPYSPELNPVEKLGDLVKDRVCNRLYPSLRRLEDHILAALHPWRSDPQRVAALIGSGWLLDGVNAGVPI